MRSQAGGVRSGAEVSSRGSGGNASRGRTQALGGNGFSRYLPLQGVRRRLGRTGYVRSCQNHSPICQVWLNLAWPRPLISCRRDQGKPGNRVSRHRHKGTSLSLAYRRIELPPQPAIICANILFESDTKTKQKSCTRPSFENSTRVINDSLETGSIRASYPYRAGSRTCLLGRHVDACDFTIMVAYPSQNYPSFPGKARHSAHQKARFVD